MVVAFEEKLQLGFPDCRLLIAVAQVLYLVALDLVAFLLESAFQKMRLLLNDMQILVHVFRGYLRQFDLEVT